MSTHDGCDKRAGYPLLVWRIGVAMAEAGIRTNRELRKRLTEVGFQTSEATLCRLRKVDLRAIDLEMLAALCAVLGATPDDLLAPKGGWPSRQSRTAPRTESAPSRKHSIDNLASTNAPGPKLEKPTASSMLGPRIKPVNTMERARK